MLKSSRYVLSSRPHKSDLWSLPDRWRTHSGFEYGFQWSMSLFKEQFCIVNTLGWVYPDRNRTVPFLYNRWCWHLPSIDTEVGELLLISKQNIPMKAAPWFTVDVTTVSSCSAGLYHTTPGWYLHTYVYCSCLQHSLHGFLSLYTDEPLNYTTLPSSSSTMYDAGILIEPY